MMSLRLLGFTCVVVTLILMSEAEKGKQDHCWRQGIEDAKSFSVRMKNVTIPPSPTYYACQLFEAPHDKEYHAIMFEPLIERKEMIHHILLFGCEQNLGLQNVHQCGEVDGLCRSWLAQYAIGLEGNICPHTDTGVRLGRNTYSHVLLQIHYNNENLSSGIKDNSGMRIYYTDKIRRYDAGNVQIGQNDLEIPPGSGSLSMSGSCSSYCTQRILQHPIYLSRSYIHMHFLGISGKIEIVRDNEPARLVAKDEVYIYSKSPIHVHDPPVEVLPGDEVRVTCTYTNHGDNKTYYFGEGSEAEMCYAFISYFPKVEHFDQCLQIAEYDVNCPNPEGAIIIKHPVDDTKFTTVNASVIRDVTTTCSGQGCSDECIKKTKTVLQTSFPKSRRRLSHYGQRLLNSSTKLMTEQGFYKHMKCALQK